MRGRLAERFAGSLGGGELDDGGVGALGQRLHCRGDVDLPGRVGDVRHLCVAQR